MNRADERRGEIARTAALLFERHGFHNVSVGDVAEAVGLSKPALYHYVNSKAEIVAWIHDELIDELLARLERDVSANCDPRAGLRQVLVGTVEIVATRPGYLGVFLEHQREIPRELRAHAVARRDRFEQLVVTLVERGMDQGLLEQRSARMTSLALLAITNWSYQWYRPELGAPVEVAEQMFETFLAGAATPLGLDEPLEGISVSPTEVEVSEPRELLSDDAWAEISPMLPPQGTGPGRRWRNHREVLDAIAWKIDNDLAWHELPEDFGPWRTIYQRYVRWRKDGTWDRLSEVAQQRGRFTEELDWVLKAGGNRRSESHRGVR
ncbi:transposase [Gordonia sp. LSe1-13]|uniref:Transposase n=1 Tax=Gordonia sesuvii TaxID=3116777 RepID=A0ABU7MIR1_9ACTN|nr:transposase [Gordonia sp. LSe1-13]